MRILLFTGDWRLRSDMFESTRIIAEKQFVAAKQLYDAASEELAGPVDARTTFVDLTALTFTASDGTNRSTCGPAFGYSFAAGTTDGPGMFDFVQGMPLEAMRLVRLTVRLSRMCAGTNTSNPFWNAISHVLSAPTAAQIACHAPKPILLNLEGISVPYPWAAQTVPLQVNRYR